MTQLACLSGYVEKVVGFNRASLHPLEIEGEDDLLGNRKRPSRFGFMTLQPISRKAQEDIVLARESLRIDSSYSKWKYGNMGSGRHGWIVIVPRTASTHPASGQKRVRMYP
jgi:hypothetical protein